MQFTITSIGDAQFLSYILNSVAMLSGTGNFQAAASVGMLIGIILLGFQAISHGTQGIQFQQAFLCWILYSMCYGSTATVIVEDAFTGTNVVVDNVPFGVAAIGGIVSQIGYDTTQLLEQAFSMPSVTSAGFADALETLKEIRVASIDPNAVGAANDPAGQGANFIESWENYVAYCSTVNISAQGANFVPTILQATDFEQALAYNNTTYNVQINIGSGLQTMDCSAAFQQLDNFTTQVFLPAYKTQLATVLNVSPTEVDTKIQDAINALGLSVTDDRYILAAALAPIYSRGVVDRYMQDQGFTYATMTDDAERARVAQWQGEATLFKKTLRPVLTFIEGIFYALTPLLAFLIAIGTFGMKLAARYLQTLVWIQLWLPLLAIVNFAIQYWVSMELQQAIALNHYSISSLAGLYSLDGELQDWLAVGGLMVSSVPALAGALVAGGSFAAAGFVGRFASRLGGGEHLRPDVQAPRFGQPLIDTQSRMTLDNQTGSLMRTGWQQAGLGSFGQSERDSQEVASTYTALRQRSSAFLHQMGETYSTSTGLQQNGQTGTVFRDGTSVGYDHSDGMLRSKADEIGNSDDTVKSITQILSTKLGGSAGAGAKMVGLAASGQLSGQMAAEIASTANVSVADAQRYIDAINKSVRNDESWQTKYGHALAEDTTHGTNTMFSTGSSVQNSDALQKSASETVSAQEAYSTSSRKAAENVFSQERNVPYAVAQILRTPGAAAGIDRAAREAGLNSRAQEIAGHYRSEFSPGSDGDRAAQLYGQIMALRQTGEAGSSVVAGAMGAAYGSTASSLDPGHSPTSNRDVAATAPPAGSVARAVSAGTGRSGPLRNQVADGLANAGNNPPPSGAARGGSWTTTAGASLRGQVAAGIRAAGTGATPGDIGGAGWDPLKADLARGSAQQGATRRDIGQEKVDQFNKTSESSLDLSTTGKFTERVGTALSQSVTDVELGWSKLTSSSYPAEAKAEFQHNFDTAKSHGVTDEQAATFAYVRMSSGYFSRIGEALSSDHYSGSDFQQARTDAFYAVEGSSGRAAAEVAWQAGQADDRTAGMLLDRLAKFETAKGDVLNHGGSLADIVGSGESKISSSVLPVPPVGGPAALAKSKAASPPVSQGLDLSSFGQL